MAVIKLHLSKPEIHILSKKKNLQNVRISKYVYGSITAGYQESEGDSTSNTADVETTGYGISYAISDELSVSYGSHTAETPNNASDKDQEATAISASYVSGGMTVKASMGTVDNVGGTDATDRDTYEISMSFAF